MESKSLPDPFVVGAACLWAKLGYVDVGPLWLQGRLVWSERTGRLLLTVPADLVTGTFGALSGAGWQLWRGEDKPSVVVMSRREVESIGGASMVTERGRQFDFQLDSPRRVAIDRMPDVSSACVLPVRAPDLTALRRSYGLSSQPYGGESRLHVLVAVRKRGVLQANNTSKTQALPYEADRDELLADVFDEEKTGEFLTEEGLKDSYEQADPETRLGVAEKLKGSGGLITFDEVRKAAREALREAAAKGECAYCKKAWPSDSTPEMNEGKCPNCGMRLQEKEAGWETVTDDWLRALADEVVAPLQDARLTHEEVDRFHAELKAALGQGEKQAMNDCYANGCERRPDGSCACGGVCSCHEKAAEADDYELKITPGGKFAEADLLRSAEKGHGQDVWSCGHQTSCRCGHGGRIVRTHKIACYDCREKTAAELDDPQLGVVCPPDLYAFLHSGPGVVAEMNRMNRANRLARLQAEKTAEPEEDRKKRLADVAAKHEPGEYCAHCGAVFEKSEAGYCNSCGMDYDTGEVPALGRYHEGETKIANIGRYPVVIDRPLGTKKTFQTPGGPLETSYPTDYGYLDGLINPDDGEGLDVFVGSGGSRFGRFMKGNTLEGDWRPDERKWYHGLTDDEHAAVRGFYDQQDPTLLRDEQEFPDEASWLADVESVGDSKTGFWIEEAIGRKYAKESRFEWNGLTVRREFEPGDIRKGKDPDGFEWTMTVVWPYGEFPDIPGADGDPLDVYVGPKLEGSKVYVVDQLNADKSFDEHKVMIGFSSKDAAKEAYLEHYPDDWEDSRLGEIRELSEEEFKEWAKTLEPEAVAA